MTKKIKTLMVKLFLVANKEIIDNFYDGSLHRRIYVIFGQVVLLSCRFDFG